MSRRHDTTVAARSALAPGGQERVEDQALPQLEFVCDPAVMAWELGAAVYHEAIRVTQIAVVRHKPGGRCILRYDICAGDSGCCRTERLYGKTFASERGATVNAITRTITDADACGPEVMLPSPLAYLPHLRLLVQREVVGNPITCSLLEGNQAIAVRVAHAAHSLHTSGLELPRGTICGRSWSRSITVSGGSTLRIPPSDFKHGGAWHWRSNAARASHTGAGTQSTAISIMTRFWQPSETSPCWISTMPPCPNPRWTWQTFLRTFACYPSSTVIPQVRIGSRRRLRNDTGASIPIWTRASFAFWKAQRFCDSRRYTCRGAVESTWHGACCRRVRGSCAPTTDACHPSQPCTAIETEVIPL